MKYLDEYRDKALVDQLVSAISRRSHRKIRIMEVCGGHTLAIRKYGIPHLLPGNLELLSGPGCPVCVTDRTSIDTAIALARVPGMITATYGDLLRVPGSGSSLDHEKALGADIRIVYSTIDALELAKNNPQRQVVFLGIGFETTTPSSAVAVLEAERQGLQNFFLYSMHKLMPPAMEALIEQGIQIDSYIGPGHVTTIGGADMYRSLVDRYQISVVVSGFEPVDILQSILMLVNMAEEGRYGTEIQYTRAVTFTGNTKARGLVEKVFEPADASWRGLGLINNSGLALRSSYSRYDALTQFSIQTTSSEEPRGCICGEVLRGLKKPTDCILFGKVCTPRNPVGACMVSGEGACQAYHNYQ
jgi:hydrogenase expression/formation protein HypD